MLKIKQSKPFHYEWPHVILSGFRSKIVDLSENAHRTINNLLLLLGLMKEPVKNTHPDSR